MLNINTQKQKQNKKINKQKTTTTQYKFNIIAIITCYTNYIVVFFSSNYCNGCKKKSTHTQSKERRSKNKILKQ